MPRPNPLTAELRESAAPPPPARQPTRANTTTGSARLVGAHFPAPVPRQLRMLVAQEERTLRSLLAKAINDLVARKKLTPIA